MKDFITINNMCSSSGTKCDVWSARETVNKNDWKEAVCAETDGLTD